MEVKAAFAWWTVWSVGGREGKASESAGEETRMRYLCSLAKEFGAENVINHQVFTSPYLNELNTHYDAVVRYP